MQQMFNLKPKSTTYTKEEYIIIHHTKNNKQKHITKTNNPTNFKPQKKNKNIIRLITTLSIVFLVIGAVSFTAHSAGFLPFKPFLKIYEPVGRMGIYEANDVIGNFPSIVQIPALNNLKHKLFTSTHSINTIALDYKQRLENDGYKLEYSGQDTIAGVNFRYFGFVKGISAIGIIMTNDGGGDFGYNTLVLFTTGNIFSYKSIANWYNSR